MATPMTIVVQIDGFCNCKGCIKEVRKTLRKVGGVKLLAMNPETGEFTISTAKHPDVINYALKQAFPKKNISLLETNHPNQLPALITRQNSFSFANPLSTADVANTMVTMSHAEDLESVEYTHSSTLRMNFTNRDHNQPSTLHNNIRGFGGHVSDDGLGLPPPPTNATMPSAPYIPSTENPVLGYPTDLYGARRSFEYYDHPHGSCTIV